MRWIYPSVSPKQLCQLAHLGCTYKAGSSQYNSTLYIKLVIKTDKGRKGSKIGKKIFSYLPQMKYPKQRLISRPKSTQTSATYRKDQKCDLFVADFVGIPLISRDSFSASATRQHTSYAWLGQHGSFAKLGQTPLSQVVRKFLLAWAPEQVFSIL